MSLRRNDAEANRSHRRKARERAQISNVLPGMGAG